MLHDLQVRACICRIMENQNENQMEIRFNKGFLRVLSRSDLKNWNGVLGYPRCSPSERRQEGIRILLYEYIRSNYILIYYSSRIPSFGGPRLHID